MAKVAEAENTNKINLIGVGTTIEGNISSNENIRFDGILVGNLSTKGKVFIGQTGKVVGEIKCKNCEVEGVIEGKVIIEELLSLRSMSRIYGEIRTSKLAIEPGAILTGKCDMGGKKKHTPSQTKNKDEDSQGRSGLNDYMKYAGMGFQMLAIIGIFTWAGVKLDKRSGNDKQIFTAILSLLGVIIGIYTVLKDFIHKDDHS